VAAEAASSHLGAQVWQIDVCGSSLSRQPPEHTVLFCMNKSVSNIYIYAPDSWPRNDIFMHVNGLYLHLLTARGGVPHFLFISVRWQIVISQGDCRRGRNDVWCICDAIISPCRAATINTPMELSCYLAHQWQPNIGLLLNPLTAKSHRQKWSN
jgi:hypothetical protein